MRGGERIAAGELTYSGVGATESGRLPADGNGIVTRLIYDQMGRATRRESDNGAVVEFGCFLGLSTACLVNGAAHHGSRFSWPSG